LHCAVTRAGPLAMNNGDPITGRDKFCNAAGMRLVVIVFCSF